MSKFVCKILSRMLQSQSGRPFAEKCVKFVVKYSEWLFDILSDLEMEIQTEVETRNDYQKRVYGFLAERLFTIYVEYMKSKGLRTLELPVIYCETNPKRFKTFQFRAKIYKCLVKFRRTR